MSRQGFFCNVFALIWWSSAFLAAGKGPDKQKRQLFKHVQAVLGWTGFALAFGSTDRQAVEFSPRAGVSYDLQRRHGSPFYKLLTLTAACLPHTTCYQSIFPRRLYKFSGLCGQRSVLPELQFCVSCVPLKKSQKDLTG